MEPVLAAMMTRGIPATSKPQRPLWQRLLAPMLLASLGLHGLLLLVPTGASEDELIPPPDPEQDSVAITRVPPAAPVSPPESLLGSGASTPGAKPLGGQGQPGVGSVSSQNRGQTARQGTSSTATGTRTGRTQTRQAANSANSQTTQRNQASGAGRNVNSAGTTATTRPTTSSGGAPSPGTSANRTQTPTSPPAQNPPPSTPPPNSQPLSGNDLRAQLQAYAAELNLPQVQIDRLATSIRNRFGYNAVASADEMLPINQDQWQTLIRQETGVTDLSPEAVPTPLPMVYRQRVCLEHEPSPVKVGVLANPDGSRQGEPVILQSSGYGAVDEKALKATMEQALPTADRMQAYILTVEPSLDYGRNPCINPNSES